MRWGDAHDVASARRWAASSGEGIGTNSDGGRIDFILLADVVYREDLVAPLVDTLVELTRPAENETHSPITLLAFKERGAGPMFFQAVGVAGFQIKLLQANPQWREHCCPESSQIPVSPPTSSAEMAEVEACAMKHTAKNTSGPEIWMVVY